MSKGLEALKNIKREAGTPYFSTLYDVDMWREDFATIEKELKALEIIKEKGISLWALKSSHSVEQYNSIRNVWKYNACAFVKDLTEEEYEIIKEVFYGNL